MAVKNWYITELNGIVIAVFEATRTSHLCMITFFNSCNKKTSSCPSLACLTKGIHIWLQKSEMWVNFSTMMNRYCDVESTPALKTGRTCGHPAPSPCTLAPLNTARWGVKQSLGTCERSLFRGDITDKQHVRLLLLHLLWLSHIPVSCGANEHCYGFYFNHDGFSSLCYLCLLILHYTDGCAVTMVTFLSNQLYRLTRHLPP